ncbi:PAS domain-containing hybrid sensor histidine kinase/response regulator [soil metagenome]
MFHSWALLLIGLAYVGMLFAVATWRDGLARRKPAGTPQPFTYALSLAIYCTSWTYFGSVGVASRSGFDFLPIYIGPIIIFAAGWKLLRAIADISKRHNITSIADFIAARYGKSELLGALVAVIAVIGIIPYISIQLKAVSFALQTMMIRPGSAAEDLALLVTIAMAIFAMLFGTRHIDTTEHQDGMMMAIAVESLVKLFAFIAAGAFITFWVAGGIGPLFELAAARAGTMELFTKGFAGGTWLTMMLLSMSAIILLPRQFHVAVVENSNREDIKRAAWLFPLYLIGINLFVVPIAIAGLTLLPDGAVDGDTFVLALPVMAQNPYFALIAFIGGLSASTAMVIVETVALSIMVCNNIVMPILLRRREAIGARHQDMGSRLILIRRLAIAGVLVLAYLYYRAIGSTAALAQIGLISFAAVAQFAPAFFGVLLWKRATAAGAMAGILSGFGLWAYTLLLPSFADAGWISHSFIAEGPFGLAMLRPRILFNMRFDPLTHGVIWSLFANCAGYVCVSLLRSPTPIERSQANAFVRHDIPLTPAPAFRLWRSTVTLGEVESTVARYLGAERTARSFREAAAQRGLEHDTSAAADIRTLRFAEHLLASAIGAASSRLVMALLLERHSKNARGSLKLLDDASDAIQYNRDLLQSAIDNVEQGIAVFDSELKLVCWNRQFRTLLELPAPIGHIGAPLDEIIQDVLRQSGGEADIALAANRLVRTIALTRDVVRQRLGTRAVIEIHGNAMPDGGRVVTFTDITDQAVAADALQSANETLERRVRERTAELTLLNSELARAKSQAETANLSKTKFLAAAGHDILQPLNAARLFMSSLTERMHSGKDGELVRNVDASLEAVEDILSVLLDISRLDAGALKPDIATFRIDDLLQPLALEFAPSARARGLDLTIAGCSLAVRSDRKLLRRVLQNLLSNAIKYTPRGRVLLGCRRRGGLLHIEIHDTGHGIPEPKQKLVFQEFERLDQKNGTEPGLGLGLSIVQRIAKMLRHPVHLRSEPGRGSMFSIAVPIASGAAVAPLSASPRRSRANRIEGLTILAIDNEPAILDGMRALLEGWDVRLLTAANAAEALQLFAAQGAEIDAVLADYHLDGEDGLALIDRLRDLAGHPLAAILITADRSHDVQDLAAARQVQYLRKPLKPASLRAALSQLAVRAPAAE